MQAATHSVGSKQVAFMRLLADGRRYKVTQWLLTRYQGGNMNVVIRLLTLLLATTRVIALPAGHRTLSVIISGVGDHHRSCMWCLL